VEHKKVLKRGKGGRAKRVDSFFTKEKYRREHTRGKSRLPYLETGREIKNIAREVRREGRGGETAFSSITEKQ